MAVERYLADEGFDDRVPQAHPRRRPARIARSRAGERCHPLSPQYRAFLELHDGYDWLVPPGSMLSTTDQLPGSEIHELIRQWKAQCATDRSADVAGAIVIAHESRRRVRLPRSRATDCRRRDDGDLVHARSTHSRIQTRIAYLESRIVYCAASVPDDDFDDDVVDDD
ncbi:MAG: hypothetical protein R2939_18655 [Kofleriaceae bacterium]